MTTYTKWQLSQFNHSAPNGTYKFGLYPNGYGQAGGFIVVGFGATSTDFTIFNLGNSKVAIMAWVIDSNGNAYPNYWNSHYGTVEDGHNGGMLTWNSGGSSPYEPHSSSNGTGLADEQTFWLANMGNGNISLQAVGGAFAGQYLCGMQGGWYPDQYGIGWGSFIATPGPAAIQVHGDQLPILIITSSGYKLDLQNATLPAMKLDGFDMQQCNLAGADLTQVTSWKGTNFTGATLDKAKLDGLELSGATWTNATFIGSNLTPIRDASQASLEGAVFDGADLTGVKFLGADLTGASFKKATLVRTQFDKATLTGAHFDGATMGETSFRGAHMHGTSFNGCDLSNVYFDSAPDFTRADTNRTTFQGATVPAVDLLGNNWSWLDLTGATITKLPGTFLNLVADGALLPDGLDLRKRVLHGASFIGTRMYSVQLQNADLKGANLSKARLKGALMGGANLTLANLDGAWLLAEQVTGVLGLPPDAEPADLTGAFMFNTVLDGAHCDGVNFTNAYFLTAPSLSASQSASAIGAYMNFATFNNTWLLRTVFDGAQLSASSFYLAHLIGASFQDYDGGATELTRASNDDHTRPSMIQADIRGANFTGANMDGLNMQDATYAVQPGTFSQTFTGYQNQQVTVAFNFNATVLGNTTGNTTCPNGTEGPCTLPPGASPRADKFAATPAPLP